jgi:hypothetical protein
VENRKSRKGRSLNKNHAIIILMKKLIILIPFILVLIPTHTSNAQPFFDIMVYKPSFLRYEIVSFKVNLTQDGNPVTDSSAELTARVYFNENFVITVGNMKTVNLYYNSTDKLWYGYWPIPWNPEVGKYTLNVTANISGAIYTNSAQFNITMRQPKEVLPPGFLAMTAENVEDLTSFNVPGPYGESGNWLNMFKWAEFMGADSFWPTVGYIAGYGGCDAYAPVNQSFPWCSVTYRSFKEYCQQANASGFRCAPWIWPYSVFYPEGAENNFNITFNWTMYYDCGSGTLNENAGAISILDERAINHTKEMIEILDLHPEVNTIGIDWEPSGTWDLRLVNDEFVRKMNIQVPSEWWSNYTKQDKMEWVGRRITSGCSEYDTTFADIWHRWMAHNYALTLKRIIEESGSLKSFFMYTWSSSLGRYQGHDPFILNDAGIDIIAPMTYTAPSGISQDQKCWYESAIIDSYSKELTFQKLPNIVPGQIVWDSAYIDCTYQRYRNPPAPEDMYNRMMYSGRKMYKDGTISGLFWHDILRAVSMGYATPEPYSSVEYAIAGGAAASELRLEAGRIPINLSIEAFDEIDYGDILNGNITVTNLGSTSLNVTVFLINNTPGWEFVSSPHTVVSLPPSETKKVSFSVKSNLRNYDVDNRFMIAAKATWGNEPTDTHLEFKYIHVIPWVRISGKLKDVTDSPIQANVIIQQEETDVIVSSNQTDAQGDYYLFIPSGIYDIQFNLTNFPIPEYSVKLKSINLKYDFYEPIKYITYNSSKESVSIVIDTNNTLEIIVQSQTKPTRILKNGTALEKVSSLSNLTKNKWFYNETESKIYLMMDRFLTGFAPLFGNPNVGTKSGGYSPYLYTAGPYDVNDSVTVSSIYLYTPVAGNAKVALYDAVYNENQYLTKHNPNNLIVQSGEQNCPANSWCYFDVPDTSIPSGKYFLAIKIDTNGMVSAISRSGFGQWRTHNYADPFPDPFGTVSDATGSEYSIYACCS